jgi:hypothetical protein
MSAFKFTMIMQMGTGGQANPLAQPRTGGFSETVYYTNVSAGTINSFYDLCQLRANLLGRGGAVIGQRYQQVDPVGQASSEKRVFRSGLAMTTDNPNMAIQLRCRGANVANIRRSHIHCIPDDVTVAGEYVTGTPWDLNFALFKAGLRGWLFRGRDLTLPKVLVKDITDAGVVTFLSDLPLGVTDLVSLYRVEDANGNFVNGTFQVGVASTLRIVTLNNWKAGACKGGKAQKFSPIYPTINVAGTSLGTVSIRRVGGPFNKFRGRRSKRR